MKILRILSAFVFLVFVLGAAFPASAGQIQNQVLEVSVQRANVRDIPSLQGEILFQLNRGEKLLVIQREGEWYWVETSDRRRGYVSNIVVRPLPEEKPSPAPVESASELRSGAFGNSDIIAMVKAGLSDDIIVAAIKQAESTDFDLSPAGLIALKTGGVSEAVIKAVIDRGGSSGAAAPSRSASETSPANDGPRITELPPENQQLAFTKPAGFGEWNTRLERARAKRGRGMRFAFIGIGTVVVGPLIGGSTGSPSFVYLLALGGTGVMAYGGWTWYSARQEIEDLDQEGRIKGYLTLAPTPGGAQVALNFSF